MLDIAPRDTNMTLCVKIIRRFLGHSERGLRSEWIREKYCVYRYNIIYVPHTHWGEARGTRRRSQRAMPCRASRSQPTVE